MTERSTDNLRSSILQQLPSHVVLVVLWMLLWGAVSWLNLVTGILLAVLVTRVFYLPPVELTGRFNVVSFAVFLAHFLAELVFASFQVAFQAFSRRDIAHNSVLAVQLRTRSDFILTLTGIALSLIPGSLVVEVDREKSILYAHILDTRDAEGVDRVRHKILAVEGRLARAFASSDDLRRAKL